MNKECPKCGKALVEQKKFPGLWVCVDYVTTDTKPPYRYKCNGMRITRKAAKDFRQELNKQICERN
jgi:ribosomal protein L37AE/L43A